MNPVFLHAKVKLHWGFISRQPGASAAQNAYPLPPPTTVVGAFANPLSRLSGIPDSLDLTRKGRLVFTLGMECALRATLAAGAGIEAPLADGRVGIAVHEEPSRILGVPYKGGGDIQRAVKQPIYLGAQTLLPVQAVGEAASPGGMVHLGWLADLDVLEECFKPLSMDVLESVAWSVYRVGSREGLASVLDAGAYMGSELEIVDNRTFRSILYQHAECAKPDDITAEIVLQDYNYRESLFYAPAGLGSGQSILFPPAEPARFYLKPGCKGAIPRGKEGYIGLAFRG
ncbi:MAG: type I-A CRISPR-associated protein Cas5a [Aeropyrum sp.]|nr:type I-A CRISPR-associated protein Cas5a [Aeropyrum sp.]